MSIKTDLQAALVSDIQAYTPYLTSNHQAFALDALARSLVKKLPHSTAETAERAAREFVERNRCIQQFDPSSIECSTTRRVLYSAQSIVRSRLNNAFYEPDPSRGRFGPGASFLVPGTDIVSKYNNLTYTDVAHLSFFLRAHPWSTSTHVATLQPLVKSSRKVRGSKLTTVPKNDTIDRCIAIEPSCNMFMQQAIRHDLERVLKRWGIDFATQQDIQRKLARKGSTGHLSTVDLSAASDSISLELVRFLFPPDVVFWLELARSPDIQVSPGKFERLNVFATMGNATTFPVQTIIFLSIAEAVCRELSLSTDRENIGVYGDDIIVPEQAYGLLVDSLAAAGFSVNLEKSFRAGGFKESCGGDYYHGIDVRPYFIELLDDEADFYSALNGLEQWCRIHSVVLPNTFKVLYRGLRKFVKSPLIVPLFEEDTAGIRRYISGRYVALRIRSESRRVRLDDDRVLWLGAGGYLSSLSVRKQSGLLDSYLDAVEVGTRPPKRRTRRERCFCATPEVRDPGPLTSINKMFGLGSRYLGSVSTEK